MTITFDRHTQMASGRRRCIAAELEELEHLRPLAASFESDCDFLVVECRFSKDAVVGYLLSVGKLFALTLHSLQEWPRKPLMYLGRVPKR